MPRERRPPAKARAGTQAGKAADTVYFEFIPQGAYVKVTAIDAASGTEVSIVGAAAATQAALEQTALAKLRFVLAKCRKDH